MAIKGLANMIENLTTPERLIPSALVSMLRPDTLRLPKEGVIRPCQRHRQPACVSKELQACWIKVTVGKYGCNDWVAVLKTPSRLGASLAQSSRRLLDFDLMASQSLLIYMLGSRITEDGSAENTLYNRLERMGRHVRPTSIFEEHSATCS
jgi:hypothetical protein